MWQSENWHANQPNNHLTGHTTIVHPKTLPFINIAPYCRIEVFYFNQDQCDNYNTVHRLNETSGDKLVTPGYYYEDFNGPFATKQEAIQDAKVSILTKWITQKPTKTSPTAFKTLKP